MRMRHIVICGMSGSTLFFHLFSQTARFSGGGVIEHKMCFGFLLQIFIVIFLILGRNKRDMIKNVHLSSRNVRYSCQVLMKLEFSLPIFEKKALKYKISRKSVQMEASCSMRTGRRTDGQTYMTKFVIPFSRFCESACKKNGQMGKLNTAAQNQRRCCCSPGGCLVPKN